LPLIAAGSGRPKTSDILNGSMQQHDTANWRQSFVLTEFTSASINNYCLDSRRRDWLHCLTRLTKCHQHSHVSSIHSHITYLTRDGSQFFCHDHNDLDHWPHDFQRFSARAVTWPNNEPNLQKPKNLRRNSPKAFFMRGLVRAHLWTFSPLLDPLTQFKLLTLSPLALLHSSPAP